MRLTQTLQLFLLLASSFRSTGLQIPLEGECVSSRRPSKAQLRLVPSNLRRLEAVTAAKGASNKWKRNIVLFFKVKHVAHYT